MVIFIPIKEISQRVPNKNFRLINGVPLYKNCLYKLKEFDVFVDTDSDKIVNEIHSDKDLSHVKVYKRNKSLLGHEVSVCDLIGNFIKNFKLDNVNICQVHVTSPFIKTRTLKNAMKKLNEGYDSIVACNVYQNRLWRKESYGYCPVNHNPLKLEQTQDLPVFYEENSLFYIFNSNYFDKTMCRVGVNPYFYKCSYPENVDIDTEDDWGLVQSLIKGDAK